MTPWKGRGHAVIFACEFTSSELPRFGPAFWATARQGAVPNCNAKVRRPRGGAPGRTETLDKTAIYRKTKKGLAEITSNQRSIDRRLRPLLILVDGHRTAARIHTLMGGIGIQEQDFDQLAAGGFIETIARPDSIVAANDDVKPTQSPPPAPPQRRGAFERFSDGQRYLCETAADKLGLLSFLFVLRLEKCSSAEQLLALLPEFEQALAKKLDKDYARHCRKIAETILRD